MTWIDVNGARIDKEFLEANIKEAEDYCWEPIRPGELSFHVHCMICGTVVDDKIIMVSVCYKSKGGYVCSYCFERFLKSGLKPEIEMC